MRNDIVLHFVRGHYYSRIWFLCRRDKPLDVMAVLRRDLPDGLWRFEYRFRYYNDEKVFDSKDRKSFYSGTFPELLAESEIVERTQFAIDVIAEGMGLDVDVTVIESDDPDLVHAKLREKPHFNMQADPSGVKQ